MQVTWICLNDANDEGSPKLFTLLSRITKIQWLYIKTVERILKSFDLKFNSNNKNILANQKVEQPV